MMTLKIALRNLFRHKARSIITISTIIFGCVALIFVGGFFEDAYYQTREGHIGSQSGHIQIFKRGFNEHGKTDPYGYLIDSAQESEIKSLIKEFPEVKYVTSRLQFSGLLSTGENSVSFIGQGLEPRNEKDVPVEHNQDLRALSAPDFRGLPIMVFGKSLVEGDAKEVVLGQGLSETMSLKVDNTVTVLANTVTGSLNAFDVNIKGVFFTAAKEFDDIYLRLPLSTAQKLMNTQSVETIVVKLHDTEDTDKVIERLRLLFKQKNLDMEIMSWVELADFYNKMVELFNMFHLIIRLVVGTVVVLGIFNTMNMSVMERYSEIGTIMALGVRRKGVMKLFLFEGLSLGVIGGILGVIAGIIIVSIIATVGIKMPPPPQGNFTWLSTPKIVPVSVISTFFLSVVVGGISALYPAYKASRLQITEALRYR